MMLKILTHAVVALFVIYREQILSFLKDLQNCIVDHRALLMWVVASCISGIIIVFIAIKILGRIWYQLRVRYYYGYRVVAVEGHKCYEYDSSFVVTDDGTPALSVKLEMGKHMKAGDTIVLKNTGLTARVLARLLNAQDFEGYRQEMAQPEAFTRGTENLHGGVVFIEVDGVVLGMGFRYHDYLVTAAHVIDQAYHAGKSASIGKFVMDGVSHEKRLINLDLEVTFDFYSSPGSLDICAIKMSSDCWSILGVSRVKIGEIKNDTQVSVDGVINGDTVRSTGPIKGAAGLDKPMRFYHGASTEPSFSGTPLMFNNQAVGLHLASYSPKNSNVGVPLMILEQSLFPKAVKEIGYNVESELPRRNNMYSRMHFDEDDYREAHFTVKGERRFLKVRDNFYDYDQVVDYARLQNSLYGEAGEPLEVKAAARELGLSKREVKALTTQEMPAWRARGERAWASEPESDDSDYAYECAELPNSLRLVVEKGGYDKMDEDMETPFPVIGKVRRPMRQTKKTTETEVFKKIKARGLIGELSNPPMGGEHEMKSLRNQTNNMKLRQAPKKRKLLSVLNKTVRYYPKTKVPPCFAGEELSIDDLSREYDHLMGSNDISMDSSPGFPYCLDHSTNQDLFKNDSELIKSIVMQRIKQILSTKDLFGMKAESLVRNGVCDPVKIFIKNELHKEAKIKEGRYRLIWMTSVADQLIDRLLFAKQNKTEILNWASIPSKPGFGTTDEMSEKLYENFQELRKGGSLADTDVSGWDISVPDWLFWLDFERRAKLNGAGKQTLWYRLAKARFHCLLNSLLVLSDGRVCEQKIPGVLKSGTYCTSSSNSAMRVMLSCLVTGTVRIMAMGDDAIEPYQPDLKEKYESLGFKIKSVQEVGDEFEFCSHIYRNKEGMIVAEPLNKGKALGNFAMFTPHPLCTLNDRLISYKQDMRHTGSFLEESIMRLEECGMEFSNRPGASTQVGV